MFGEALRNKNYVLELAGFSFLNCVFISFTVILSPIFEPYGYSPTFISLMGGIFIIVGVVSSIICGAAIDKNPKYLLLFRIICVGSTLMFATLIPALMYGNRWLVGVNVALAGFVLVPIMPIGIGFACELTFPIEATVTNGIL